MSTPYNYSVANRNVDCAWCAWNEDRTRGVTATHLVDVGRTSPYPACPTHAELFVRTEPDWTVTAVPAANPQEA